MPNFPQIQLIRITIIKVFSENLESSKLFLRFVLSNDRCSTKLFKI